MVNFRTAGAWVGAGLLALSVPVGFAVPAGAVAQEARLVVTGEVVTADGPARSYTVKPGEGLDAVARKNDTTRAVLAELNRLKAPYTIRPGQKLKLPPIRGKAYVVGNGDTMANVAKRFNVTPQALASYNGMSRTAALRAGRKLLLPPGFRDGGPIQVAGSAGPAQPAVNTAQPYRKVDEPVPPPVLTPLQPGPPPTPGQIADAGSNRFVWPLTGRILSSFGPKGEGLANEGINIAARDGDPVRAAAGGRVLYSGSAIPNFGTYVLISHDGGFLTAYAHLSRSSVRIGDTVQQGQEIGQAGQTGDVAQPQLHFEILYAARREDKAAPVDPVTLLPQ